MFIICINNYIHVFLTDIKTLRQTARETDERYQKAFKSHNTVETSMKNTTSDLLSETKRLKDKLLKVIYMFINNL